MQTRIDKIANALREELHNIEMAGRQEQDEIKKSWLRAEWAACRNALAHLRQAQTASHKAS